MSRRVLTLAALAFAAATSGAWAMPPVLGSPAAVIVVPRGVIGPLFPGRLPGLVVPVHPHHHHHVGGGCGPAAFCAGPKVVPGPMPIWPKPPLGPL